MQKRAEEEARGGAPAPAEMAARADEPARLEAPAETAAKTRAVETTRVHAAAKPAMKTLASSELGPPAMHQAPARKKSLLPWLALAAILAIIALLVWWLAR